jgi:hypothetical protein
MPARLGCVPLFLEPRICGTASSGVPGAPTAGHPPSVRQADGLTRPTGGAIAARLVLGDLAEDTCFVEYDVDCDAGLILGYDWLRAHDLAFLYASDAVCLCAERGCTSGRRVRLNLVSAAPASPALRLPVSPADATALLRDAGLEVQLWAFPRSGRRRAAAVRSRSLHSWRQRRLRGRRTRSPASLKWAKPLRTALSSWLATSPSRRRVRHSPCRRTPVTPLTLQRWPTSTPTSWQVHRPGRPPTAARRSSSASRLDRTRCPGPCP